MENVEFAVLGAGAIGSIIGAHLARAGHSVVMLARGERARRLSTHGIRVTGLAEFAQAVPVLSDPAQLQSAGALILATKTHGTDSALAPLAGSKIGVAFSIQNGLKKNEQLAGVFGAHKVLGCLADTSGELLASGDVLFTRNVAILLGEIGKGAGTRAPGIAAALDAAGVRAEAVPDIESLEWSKFAAWIGLAALSVTMRVESWKYLCDADSALALARLVREIGALAASRGVTLSDRSTLPVAAICSGTLQQAVAVIQQKGRDMHDVAPQHRMSILQDFQAGRPLEVEETFGYAVRKAAEKNLALPLLDSFYHLVAAMDRVRSC